jgi:hypothetical protein
MLKFLRLRLFWGVSSPGEREFAFASPEILKCVEFNALLTALATTELSRQEIQERSKKALVLLGEKSNFPQELLKQWEYGIRIVANSTTGPIGRHKAYSGWVRNSSTVGSKRPGTSSIPEPLSEEFSEDQFDKYEFLLKAITVGEIETNSGWIIRTP